jgi:hypothetical protein
MSSLAVLCLHQQQQRQMLESCRQQQQKASWPQQQLATPHRSVLHTLVLYLREKIHQRRLSQPR